MALSRDTLQLAVRAGLAVAGNKDDAMSMAVERSLLRAAAEAELEAIRKIVGAMDAAQEEAIRTAFKAGARFGVERARSDTIERTQP